MNIHEGNGNRKGIFRTVCFTRTVVVPFVRKSKRIEYQSPGQTLA